MKHLHQKIKVDNDPMLGYEKNTLIKKMINALFIPILNVLPIKSRNLIKKSHKSVGEIVDNATSHKALEILYKKGIKKHTNSTISKVTHRIWFNTNNSKAARNRLKLVKREIFKACQYILATKDTLSIVSIAAGSARAVLETIHEINPGYTKQIKLLFIDKNPDALSYSKEIFKELQLDTKENIIAGWEENTVNGFLNSTANNFDLIEMVGLMDYFSDEKALTIFSKIFTLLNNNGYFITANINKNSEMKFVTKAIGWPMIYRTAPEIGYLVEQSGFRHELMSLYYEPLKIHSVIVAKK